MADEIRVCNPYEIKYMLEYDESRGVFKGFMSPVVNQLVVSMARFSNVTFNIRSVGDGIGEKVSESSEFFNGCIGRIQKNESDLLMRGITYPLDAAHVTQGDIVLDSVLQFITAYSPREELEAVGIESCVNSFDLGLWFLCLMTLLIILSLLHLRVSMIASPRGRPSKRIARFRAKYKYLLYQVATHATKYGQMFASNGKFNRIIFFTLSYFSFMLLFYFGSMMKTELVVVREPETFKSYKDLLDRKVGISFLLASDSYLYFKFAPKGSYERQLWDTTRSKFAEADMLFSADLQKVGAMLNPFFTRKLAFVAESTWMRLAMREVCSISFNQEKIDFGHHFGMPTIKPRSLFPFLSQDEHAKALLKGFIFNKKPSRAAQRVRKTIRHMFEMGIMGKVIDLEQDFQVFDALMSGVRGGSTKKESSLHLVKNCEKSVLYMPEVELTTVKFSNILNLMHIMLYVLAGIFIILIFEILFNLLVR